MVWPQEGLADSSISAFGLQLHDQGGLVNLPLADGSPSDYSVELTQLVYGRSIGIMKLAVYRQAAGTVDYNSRAISYAWADPSARRLGLNLRSFQSGWTLIAGD